MYIHLMEMSPTPEAALQAGDLLRDLVPDAGHLRHMPTHLDVLCGDYARVVSSNTAAIEADEKFRARRGGMNFYTLYRAHDYHFKIYGAMFLGQAQVALDTADQLAAAIPEDLLRVGPADGGLARRLRADEDARADPVRALGGHHRRAAARRPGPVLRDHGDNALRQGGRAGRHGPGRRGRRATPPVRGRGDPGARLAHRVQQHLPGHPPDRGGHAGRRAGVPPGALRRGLRGAAPRSIDLDDGLPYDEPWGWMQPARHAYGALLLEQGRVEEAEAVYRADLGLDGTLARACQHPGNVWSLHGYHECLTRLGKQEQAGIIGQQLTIAAARADVPITASCYCRLAHGRRVR